jgi:hypothetical protein
LAKLDKTRDKATIESLERVNETITKRTKELEKEAEALKEKIKKNQPKPAPSAPRPPGGSIIRRSRRPEVGRQCRWSTMCHQQHQAVEQAGEQHLAALVLRHQQQCLWVQLHHLLVAVELHQQAGDNINSTGWSRRTTSRPVGSNGQRN